MEEPIKQQVILHESGKANGLVEKVGNATFPLSASLSGFPDTQLVLVDTMQWEKEQKKDLRRALPKVNSFPTSHLTNLPAVTELSGAEDEIPLVFEGQRRMGDLVAKEPNAFEGHVGNLDSNELRCPQHAFLDALSLVIPSGPYHEVI